MSAAKLALPALSLSQQDIQAKLANSEARWKVGAQLDHLLYGDLAADEGKKRRKGSKPKLRSQRKREEEDPETLKARLHEKELAAQLNREREISKLQEKLARQEQRARKVLERKRALGHGASNEDLHLSWGGEKGLAEMDTETSLPDSTDSLKHSGNSNGANRLGSGKSVQSDASDATQVSSPAPRATGDSLKKNLKQGLAGLAPRSRNVVA
ncbi:hypothetical protein HDU91_000995 [Kappamyces sp. JEL0680]|nr:hypothetical protein HDU91_000995 [Kappamyces sp. JEL0680]